VIDDEGRLVLVKRAKPGQVPYWTSPGGVDDFDATVEDALRTELAEELGATADGYRQVFLSSDSTDVGVAIQHFFLAWLTSLNLAGRHGPEFARPERGGYDLDYVSLGDDSLDAIDLRPAALKEFVLANRDALLAEAGFAA
jgi:ADP-ribose pyrophosphatase YjhB (NUDIX family)